MKTCMTLPLMIVLLIGHNAVAQSEPEIEYDRSTPSATFKVVQQGNQKRAFKQVAESYSPQHKRFMLFEVLFSSGMVGEEKRERLDSLFADCGIDIKQLDQESSNVEELVNKYFEAIDDPDEFLNQAFSILYADRRLESTKMVDVVIDGSRAEVTYEIEGAVVGYRKGADGVEEEIQSRRQSKMYLRRFQDRWLVCSEQEWKDSSFIWTVPDK